MSHKSVAQNNTLFDDVFRTMAQKMPQLIIPIINEAFNTKYSMDEHIDQLRNEHEEKTGKIITDSIFVIKGKTYHIECQSSDDKTMAIRMIEYDFSIALESQKKSENDDRMYEVALPQSCVLYIRNDEKVPDILKVKVILPNDDHFIYECKTLKMSDYTSDEIFKRKLLFLLPYYILRYEKQAKSFDTHPEKLQYMLEDMGNIRGRLAEELDSKKKSILYTDLINLIIKISDHIFRNSKSAKKGVKSIMGGKVLQLKSEQLMKQGFKEGKKEGKKEGASLLAETIKRLKAGATEEQLLKEGIPKEIVDLAYTCK